MRGLPKKGVDGRPVWPDNATAALLECLPTYGGMEKNGKWQLIADHIYKKTGVLLTAKQVGSKLQSLRSSDPFLRAQMLCSANSMSGDRRGATNNRAEGCIRSAALRPVFSWDPSGPGSDDERETAGAHRDQETDLTPGERDTYFSEISSNSDPPPGKPRISYSSSSNRSPLSPSLVSPIHRRVNTSETGKALNGRCLLHRECSLAGSEFPRRLLPKNDPTQRDGRDVRDSKFSRSGK
ncbi:hypothetical protein FB451DRAFT_1227580 [Mycena latifolia]|nr:hypothetical protein FB451DRAFT_1227580 [Mycena latifolia]